MSLRIITSYLAQKFELLQTPTNVTRHILAHTKREAMLSEYSKYVIGSSDSTSIIKNIEHLSALAAFCREYEDWRFSST